MSPVGAPVLSPEGGRETLKLQPGPVPMEMKSNLSFVLTGPGLYQCSGHWVDSPSALLCPGPGIGLTAPCPVSRPVSGVYMVSKQDWSGPMGCVRSGDIQESRALPVSLSRETGRLCLEMLVTYSCLNLFFYIFLS